MHQPTRRDFIIASTLSVPFPLLASVSLGADDKPPQKYEWPQYKGNSGLTGVSPDDTVRPPFKLVWSYRTDGDTSGDAGAGVIVAGGKVFATIANTFSLLALDAEDGSLAWEFHDPHMSYNSVPTYSDGKLYLWKRRGDRCIVLAVDARTGKPVWEQALPSKGRFESRAGLPVVDGKVFCVAGGEEPAVVALDAATGKEVWKTGLGTDDGPNVIAPSVAGGVVFVGTRIGFGPSKSDVGATIALNASDGKILWRRAKVFPLKPVTTDGKVVACPMTWSADSRFHMLDAKTGETLWTAPQRFHYSPSSLTSDIVLIKPYGGDVIAVDRESGKQLWSFSGKTTSGCCAPTIAGGHAYFGTGVISPGDIESLAAWQHVTAPRERAGYGTLFALDMKTGKSVWHFSTGNTVCGEPAIAYGKIYFASRDGKVYCFAPAKDGEPTVPEAKDRTASAPPEQVKALLVPERTDRPVPGKVWPMAGGSPDRAGLAGITLNPPLEPAWKLDAGGRVVTSAAIRDGTVFIGSDAGKLLALEGKTGKLAWEARMGGRVRCAPAVVGGLVFCGADSGTFVAVEADTGKPKWRFEAGGPVQASPAVVGGMVVFGANDHSIYALDAGTGRKLWSFRMNDYCIHAPPVVHGGRVFVGQWTDWVHAVDLHTGKPLWRSFVPISIEAVAYYRDKLYVRTPYYIAELDPATGKRLRIGNASCGTGGIAFMKNLLFQSGVQGQYGTSGGTVIDLDEPGKEMNRAIPTLEGVLQISQKGLKGAPDLGAMGTPLVLGERVCFAARDGRVFLVEPDGKIVWSHRLGGMCHSSPVAVDGLLVVGCDDGLVYAFRDKS